MPKLLWLIEDDHDQRHALSGLLRADLNYRVLEFVGWSQLETLSNDVERPCAILMDLALIGSYNGFQVATRIVDKFGFQPGLFIFMTGWSKQFDASRPEMFRANALIDKANWTIEQLEAALKHCDIRETSTR